MRLTDLGHYRHIDQIGAVMKVLMTGSDGLFVGRSPLLATSDEPQAGRTEPFENSLIVLFLLCDSYCGATGAAEMISVSAIRSGDLLNACSA